MPQVLQLPAPIQPLSPLALSHDMTIGHMTTWKPGSERSSKARAMAIKAILNKKLAIQVSCTLNKVLIIQVANEIFTGTESPLQRYEI